MWQLINVTYKTWTYRCTLNPCWGCSWVSCLSVNSGSRLYSWVQCLMHYKTGLRKFVYHSCTSVYTCTLPLLLSLLGEYIMFKPLINTLPNLHILGQIFYNRSIYKRLKNTHPIVQVAHNWHLLKQVNSFVQYSQHYKASNNGLVDMIINNKNKANPQIL